MMTTKKAAIELAQRTANREGKPMAVLNLNPFGALYVVRDYDPSMLGRELVSIVGPQGQEIEITTAGELLARLQDRANDA
jgi:hypothetical protein